MEPIVGERYRVIPGTKDIIRRWHGHEVKVVGLDGRYVYVATGVETPWGARLNGAFTNIENFMRAMELVGGPDENIPEVW